jgi:hypothetical protein
MPRMQAWLALAVSLGLHAVLLARALGGERPPPPRPDPTSLVSESAAVLPGETFDIDALPLAPSAPAAGAPPASAASSSPQRPPSPTPPVRTPPPAASERALAGAPTAAPADARASGSYGEETSLLRTASLGKGLLRVLPRAAYPVASFHELPFGSTAKVRFSLDLDAAGHLTSPPRFDQDRPREPWLEAIIVRACLLLRTAAFALGAATPGSHAFDLKVEVLRGAPRTGDFLEPRDLAEIGRLVEPTLLEPGRAHFIYNSGREVRLTLALVPGP